MEDFTSLASGCLVYSASDDTMGRPMVGGAVPAELTNPKVAPILMRRHSGAFARVTILPGVTIGDGAMICAHSLVTHSIPDWLVASGAPADRRVPRRRRPGARPFAI
jgi:hypothetical protein